MISHQVAAFQSDQLQRGMMAFIDWSDPEEMFGLLTEYVADERGDARGDPDRARFLGTLLEDLETLGEEFVAMSHNEAIEALREIHRNQPADFEDDPVLTHLDDCIEELERIRAQSSG